MKLPGVDRAARWMDPADQRLTTRDDAGGKVDLGLIEEQIPAGPALGEVPQSDWRSTARTFIAGMKN